MKTPVRKPHVLSYLKFSTLLLMFLCTGLKGWGQSSLTLLPAGISQNFNSLNGNTWTDNVTLTGWYAATVATSSITTYGLNTGSSTSAGMYSYGNISSPISTDRALGYATSNAFSGNTPTGANYLGWRLKNTTGVPLSSITVTWTGEQWRRDNTVAQKLILSYQKASSVTSVTSGTWTTTTSEFTSPQIIGSANALDGNNSLNRTANIAITITVLIQPNEEIMLRWVDLNDTGNDHHLAIDDVTVTASCAITTYAITGTSSCSTSPTAIGISNSDIGYTYSLLRGSSVIATNAGTGSSFTFGNFDIAGTYTVSAVHSSNAACTATMTGNVIISSPVTSGFSFDENLCTNSSSELPSITGTAGGTFSSSSSDLVIDPVSGEIDPSSSIPGSYDITYTVNGAFCPTSQRTESVNINEPVLTVDAGLDYSICETEVYVPVFADITPESPSHTYLWTTTGTGEFGSGTLESDELLSSYFFIQDDIINSPITFTIEVTSPGCNSMTDNIAVTIIAEENCFNPQDAADFRSKKDGSFTDPLTWEYLDGSIWTLATQPPSSSNNILITHHVTLDTDFSLDAMKTMTVQGILELTDEAIISGDGSMSVSSTGTLSTDHPQGITLTGTGCVVLSSVTFDPSSTVEFTGGTVLAPQQIAKLSGAVKWKNIVLKRGFQDLSEDITVAGTFSIESLSSFNMRDRILSLESHLINLGLLSSMTGGKIVFSGSSDQNWLHGCSSSCNYGDVEVSNGHAVTLSGTASQLQCNSLYVSSSSTGSSSTLDLSSVSLYSSTSVTVSSSTLKSGPVISLGTDFTLTGSSSFDPNNGQVIFAGSPPVVQNLYVSSSSITFASLTLNNPILATGITITCRDQFNNNAGRSALSLGSQGRLVMFGETSMSGTSGTDLTNLSVGCSGCTTSGLPVTCSSSLYISNDLHFEGSVLSCVSNAVITLEQNAVTTGGNPDGFVDGAMAIVPRNILKTYFETGDVPAQDQFHMPVEISCDGTCMPGQFVTVESFATDHPQISSSGIPSGRRMHGFMKTTRPVSMTTSVLTTELHCPLSLLDQDLISSPPSSIMVYRWDGSSWESITTASVVINTDAMVVTFSSSQGGDFTIGSQCTATEVYRSSSNGLWSDPSTWSVLSTCGTLIPASSPPSSSSSVTLQHDITLDTDVTISQSSILHLSGSLYFNDHHISGDGSFSSVGGTLHITSPDGISSSGQTGHIRTLSRSVSSSSSCTFSGSSAQVTGDLLSECSTLTINNGDGVTLSSTVKVSSNLVLTAGTIKTGSVYTLSLSSSCMITGGSSLSYVDGSISRDLDDVSSPVTISSSFPVGNDLGYYPVVTNLHALTFIGSTLHVSAPSASTSSLVHDAGLDPLHHVPSNWDISISSTAGGSSSFSSIDITFEWPSSSSLDETKLHVRQLHNGVWSSAPVVSSSSTSVTCSCTHLSKFVTGECVAPVFASTSSTINGCTGSDISASSPPFSQGTEPFTYQWSGSSGTLFDDEHASSVIASNWAGTIHVTGSNGCGVTSHFFTINSSSPQTYYRDADNDLYGDSFSGTALSTCSPPSGYITTGGDCDDTNPAINPAAAEICDSGNKDEDCDGVADDADASATGQTAFYLDADGDGYGVSGSSMMRCDAPQQHVSVSGDCDDNKSTVNPGASEICDASNEDEDCDGVADDADVSATGQTAFYLDADGDGYGVSGSSMMRCDAPQQHVSASGDCDDSKSTVNPGASEICDASNEDEDCDGVADDADVSATGQTAFYLDADGDGYGVSGSSMMRCDAPPQHVSVSGDCDDSKSTVNPGANEICDASNEDEDCDGVADDADASATGQTAFYLDADGDGYGVSGSSMMRCDAPQQHVSVSGDCDDSKSNINPGASEICDASNEDEDCDGVADDADASATGQTAFYLDADGDGYGVTGSSMMRCDAPQQHVSVSGDCDDSKSNINPGANEICDASNEDEDCDGLSDDDDSFALGKSTFYLDDDGDSYGGPVTSQRCDGSLLYVSHNNDCDDADASIHPGAVELCNSTDDDCDGATDEGITAPSAGTISGPPNQCIPVSAGSATFTVPADPSISTYNWTIPSGMTLQSGQGTNAISVSWTTGSASTGIVGEMCVVSGNECASGTATCRSIDFTGAVPVTPGSISGAGKTCPGTISVYSVAPVARASHYVWTLPPGMQIISGDGTNIITIECLPGYTGGTCSVRAANSCGASSIRTKSLGLNLPLAPGAISGQATGFCGTQGMVYSTSGAANADTYLWTVPSGGTIVSGQGTSSVVIDFSSSSSSSSSITVTGENGCGSGSTRSLTVTPYPSRPAVPSGSTTVCTGSIHLYSIPTVTGASLYNWTVPSGASIYTGQGTKSPEISFTSSGSNKIITVSASNSCGSSPVSVLGGITVQSCARMDNESISQPEVYPNPASGIAYIKFIAEKDKPYSLSILDISGRMIFIYSGTGTGSTEEHSVDTQQFSKGIYLLQLKQNHQQHQVKLIVE